MLELIRLKLDERTIEKEMAVKEAQFLQHQRDAERLQREYVEQRAQLDRVRETFHGKLVAAQGDRTGWTVNDKLEWRACPSEPSGAPGCDNNPQPSAAETAPEIVPEEQPAATESAPQEPTPPENPPN